MEANAMSYLITQLKTLCQETQDKWEITYGVNEIEDCLLKILILIKQNSKHRSEFSDYFIERIQRKEKFPLEIIIFCMRELQWVEIEEAVTNEMYKASDPRIISAMKQILEVYEVDWEDGDMYEYYSKKD